MSKAEYFTKFKAGQRAPVEGADGLPPLFAKKMTSAEFSDCLEAKKIDGKDDFIINYSKATVASVIQEDGTPYFTEADLPELASLGVDGLSPFVKAINQANGLGNRKNDETAVVTS